MGKQSMSGTLSQHYNESFLKKAEGRRSKLKKLGSIEFGPRNNKKIDRIQNLLRIIHQNYYLEFYDAVCTLSGVFFEQTLGMVLDEKYRELKGRMFIRRRGELQQIHSREDLAELGMNDLINLARQERFLTDKNHSLAHQLRLIRNKVIHEGSFFMKKNEQATHYEAEVEGYGGRTEIVRVSVDEVEKYCQERRWTEIGAYYVLTRTRMLVHDLCAFRVDKDKESQA